MLAMIKIIISFYVLSRRSLKGEPATWHPSAWSASKEPFPRKSSDAGKCTVKSAKSLSKELFRLLPLIYVNLHFIKENFSSFFVSLSQFLRWQMGRISTFNGNYVFLWHLCCDALLHWAFKGKWTIIRPAKWWRETRNNSAYNSKKYRFHISRFVFRYIFFPSLCCCLVTMMIIILDVHATGCKQNSWEL